MLRILRPISVALRHAAGDPSRVADANDVTEDRRIEADAFERLATWGQEALALARDTKGVSPRARMRPATTRMSAPA